MSTVICSANQQATRAYCRDHDLKPYSIGIIHAGSTAVLEGLRDIDEIVILPGFYARSDARMIVTTLTHTVTKQRHTPRWVYTHAQPIA